MTFRGTFRDGIILPHGHPDIPNGTPVQWSPSPGSKRKPSVKSNIRTPRKAVRNAPKAMTKSQRLAAAAQAAGMYRDRPDWKGRSTLEIAAELRRRWGTDSVADVLVLDTSVLVDHQRNDPRAVEFVNDLLARNVGAIHPVTHAEMIAGVPDRPFLTRTRNFLASFRRLAVRNSDFAAAIASLEQFSLSHRIGWPDCLIAATCVRVGLPLVTINDKHFKPIRGLSVVRPY